MPSRLCEGYGQAFKSFLYSPRSVFEPKSPDSHLDLAAGDGEGGAGGEAGDDGLGDEVNEEAEPEVAADEDDDPREEGQQWSVVDSIRLNFISEKLR